jgi:hypothetical protein
MASPPPFVTIQLQGGRWQQVEWVSWATYSSAGSYGGPGKNTLLSKHYICPPGVHVDWQWFSAGFPWYFWGSFTGDAWIYLAPSPYLSLEFKPAVNCTLKITTATQNPPPV